jgi:uncharacterized protein (TIGR02391 family)
MAKKQEPSASEPPSVTPERGIELLRGQQERARQLLANRPLDPNDYEAWQLTTRAYLVASFGSGSPNVARVMNAGKLSFAFPGATEDWYEERHAGSLITQLKLLGSCIQQLEAEIESANAKPPSSGPLLAFESLHPVIVRRCKLALEAGLYDDAVRNAFIAVEEDIRNRVWASPKHRKLTPLSLVSEAMGSRPPCLVFSEVEAEQDGAHALFRGAFAWIRNPSSHRFIGMTDPARTLEVLALASLLLHMLDEAVLERWLDEAPPRTPPGRSHHSSSSGPTPTR